MGASTLFPANVAKYATAKLVKAILLLPEMPNFLFASIEFLGEFTAFSLSEDDDSTPFFHLFRPYSVVSEAE